MELDVHKTFGISKGIPRLYLSLHCDCSAPHLRLSGPRITAVLMALIATLMLPVQLTAAGTHNHVISRSRAEILAEGGKVADWQLTHLSNFDYIPANQFRRDAEAPRDWVQAAFYIGLAAFADTTQNIRYKNAILAHGEAEAWGFERHQLFCLRACLGHPSRPTPLRRVSTGCRPRLARSDLGRYRRRQTRLGSTGGSSPRSSQPGRHPTLWRGRVSIGGQRNGRPSLTDA